jgi:hypothetical protein
MGMARASRPLLMALKPAPNREHCVERVGASGIVNGVVNLLPVDRINEHEGARLPGASVLCGSGKARDVLPDVESMPVIRKIVVMLPALQAGIHDVSH